MSRPVPPPPTTAPPRGGRLARRLPRAPRRPTGWAAVGTVVGGLLLVVLAWRATAIVGLMHSDADLAAPLVMAEQAHRYSDAQLVTGRVGWWAGLWFLQLIRPLPGNSYVGDLLPLLLTVAVAFGVAQQAARLWGPRARWIVLLVALAVGAETWANFAAWSSRTPTWWATGLLGVVAVGLARGDRRRLPWLGGAGAACLLAALVASGDQMADAPLAGLVVSGAYAAWHGRRRLGAGLVLMAASTFVVGVLIGRLADGAGYLRQEFPLGIVSFADLGRSLSNLLLAVEGVWRGAQGDSGVEVGLATTLGTAAGYLGFGLVCVAVVAVVRAAPRAWRRPAAGASQPGLADDLRLQRGIWVSFWAVALVAYLLAFWLTTAGGPLGSPVVRYLYGVPLAAAASLAPLAARRTGGTVVAAAALLASLTVLTLALHRPQPVSLDAGGMGRPELLGRIGEVAAAERVTRGYAGYWTAYPLVLHSGFALDVTPVGMCTTTDGICTMYLHYIDQAYAPRPGVRSFLVVDRSAAAGRQWRGSFVTTLPAGLTPEKVVPVGEGVELAIFPYDLARRLQPNRELGDPRVGRGGPLAPH